MTGSTYNPDVLTCLANLSNDEVFTPPEVANLMLDMLPQNIFADKNTKFLDPACKSGVFLREIAKRLVAGLEKEMPDLQERINHIFTKQLYAIAITELTSLLGRRSVYCSKDASGKYSVPEFARKEGNIFYQNCRHTWQNGKCLHCGANEEEYGDSQRTGLESHAYQFIHNEMPEEIKDMKFDVIIGNPPYQMSTGGFKAQATPLYDKFFFKAKKLNPRHIVMIIPARWYSGGMGLDTFRTSMLTERKIIKMVDYPNAKDCFSGLSIGGGVCYFRWDKDYDGDCEFTNISNDVENTMMRKLDEFPVLVRYNDAIYVLRKIKEKNEDSLDKIMSSLMPFGLSTNVRGRTSKSEKDNLQLFASDSVTYISENEVKKGKEMIPKYKIFMSKTSAEHAGEPDKNGMFSVFTKTMKVARPNDVCTHSYFVIGLYDSELEAENTLKYLKTRFVRFIVSITLSAINLSKLVFLNVPLQDFTSASDIDWTKSVSEIDAQLYAKYGLTQEEINFIKSMIRPME